MQNIQNLYAIATNKEFSAVIWPCKTLPHLVPGLDEGHVGDDLNGSLGDLGGDAEGLEEGGLLGSHTSVLGGHRHIQGGQGSRLGRGLHLVSQQQVPEGKIL